MLIYSFYWNSSCWDSFLFFNSGVWYNYLFFITDYWGSFCWDSFLLGLYPVFQLKTFWSRYVGTLSCFQLRLLGHFLLGLFPVVTLSCFACQAAGALSGGTHSVGTLSCFPTQAAGTLSAGTLSVLTASVGTLSCWDSFRSDSFHHPILMKNDLVTGHEVMTAGS